jgi:hypothetical protein
LTDPVTLDEKILIFFQKSVFDEFYFLCFTDTVCHEILAKYFNKFADIITRDGLIFGRNGIATAKKGQTWLAGISWRVSGKSYRRSSHPGWENPPRILPVTLIVIPGLSIGI